MGRPLHALSAPGEDEVQLAAWTKRPKTAQALAMRSRVVLLAAEGNSNTAIAERLNAYRPKGLDNSGLTDIPLRPIKRMAVNSTVNSVCAARFQREISYQEAEFLEDVKLIVSK